MLSQTLHPQPQGASTPTLGAATPAPTPPSRSRTSLTPILDEQRLTSGTSQRNPQSDANGDEATNEMMPTLRTESRGDDNGEKCESNWNLCLRCIHVYGWFTIMVVLLIVAVLVGLRPSQCERNYERSMGGEQPVLRMRVV